MRPENELQTDELRPGDLLFFARPSLIQRFSENVDDEFRGVAVFDQIDDRRVFHLCGRTAGFETRELIDVIPHYDRIAVGRSARCQCTSSMLAWVRSKLSESNRYQTTALLLAFFLSWARNPRPGFRGSAVSWLVTALVVLDARVHRVLNRNRNAYICSTWMADAQLLVCPSHRITCDLTSSKPTGKTAHDPLALGRRRQAINQLLISRFLTPSDLWRAVPRDRRAELDLGGRSAT